MKFLVVIVTIIACSPVFGQSLQSPNIVTVKGLKKAAQTQKFRIALDGSEIPTLNIDIDGQSRDVDFVDRSDASAGQDKPAYKSLVRLFNLLGNGLITQIKLDGFNYTNICIEISYHPLTRGADGITDGKDLKKMTILGASLNNPEAAWGQNECSID